MIFDFELILMTAVQSQVTVPFIFAVCEKPFFKSSYLIIQILLCSCERHRKNFVNILIKQFIITSVYQWYFSKIITFNAQKMKFSIKDFFGKRDQIRIFLRIWSHLMKKSLMENFIFCTVLMSKLTTRNLTDGEISDLSVF